MHNVKWIMLAGACGVLTACPSTSGTGGSGSSSGGNGASSSSSAASGASSASGGSSGASSGTGASSSASSGGASSSSGGNNGSSSSGGVPTSSGASSSAGSGSASSSSGGSTSSGGSSGGGSSFPALTALQVETFADAYNVQSAGQLGIAVFSDGAPLVAFPDGPSATPVLRTITHFNEQWVVRDVENTGIRPRVELAPDGRVSLVFARITENQLQLATFDRGWQRTFLEAGVRRGGDDSNWATVSGEDGGIQYAAWRDSNEDVLRFAQVTATGLRTVTLLSGDEAGARLRMGRAPDGTIHLLHHSTSLGWRHSVRAPAGSWTHSTADLPGANALGGVAMSVGPDGVPEVLAANVAGELELWRSTGGAWAKTVVNPNGAIRVNQLRHDAEGRPHVLFTCVAGACGASSDRLVYARRNGAAWQEFTIHDGSAFEPNLALDSRGAPHVAYVVQTATGNSGLRLRYAHYGISTPSNDVTTATVDAAGGTLASADGFARLTIPAGALAQATNLTMRRVPRAEWSTAGIPATTPVPVYRMLPAGTAFTSAATLETRVSPSGAYALADAQGGAPRLVADLVGAASTERGTNPGMERVNGDLALKSEVPHFTDAVHVATGPSYDFVLPSDYQHVELGSSTRITARAGPHDESVGFEVEVIVGPPGVLAMVDGSSGVTGTFEPGAVSDRFEFDIGAARCVGMERDTGFVQLEIREITTEGVFTYYEQHAVVCVPPRGPRPMGEAFAATLGTATMPMMNDVPAGNGGTHPETGADGQSVPTAVTATSVGAVAIDVDETQADAFDDDSHCNLVTSPCQLPAGETLFFAISTASDPVALPPEREHTWTVALDTDATSGWIPPVVAPGDPYLNADYWFSVRVDATPQQNVTVESRRVNPDGMSTSVTTEPFFVRFIPEGIIFGIPFTSLPESSQPAGYRVTGWSHTGNLGREPGHDFCEFHVPALDTFLPVIQGQYLDIDFDTTALRLEVITDADGSEAPGGEAMAQEGEITLQAQWTPGVLPWPLTGGGLPGVVLEMTSGVDGCVQQWNGGAFESLTSMTRLSSTSLRADPLAPAGGCAVTVTPLCTPGGGIGCPPPGTPSTPTTVDVLHGTVDDFFIQTPDRICEDGEPTEFVLGRYPSQDPTIAVFQTSSSVDLYVCVLASFGAWFRYDVLTDDNPDIAWTGPPARVGPNTFGELISTINPAGPGANYLAIEGNGPGGSHGWVRTNFFHDDVDLVLPQDRTVRATGRLRFDDIEVRRAGTWPPDGNGGPYPGEITALEIRSVNTDRAGSGCATLQGPPARLCMLGGTGEQLAVWATIHGETSEEHVSTDHLVELTGSIPGVFFMDGTDRSRVLAPAPVAGPRLGTISLNMLSSEDLVVAILPPMDTVVAAPAGQVLTGVGASAPLTSVGTWTTFTGPVTVDTSHVARIVRSPRGRLGTYQAGDWRVPPTGLVAPMGTRSHGQVYLSAPAATAQVELRAAVPGAVSAPVTWQTAP